MPRLAAVAVGLLPVTALLVPVAPNPGAAPSPPATTRAAEPTPTCASVVDAMSLSEQAGQLVMVAQSSTSASASAQRAIRRAHLGSVVLLGNSTRGVAKTKRLTRSLREGVGTVDGVGLLVAADQEGGLVQRLKGPGFSRIPSARKQARWSDATLRRHAETWSTELGRAGVDVNLAPVADVVPRSVGDANAPIGALDRGFGPKPATVARKTVAVVEGMHAGGTATTAKHFPGLGRVRGNTDTTARVLDTRTTRHDALLAAFRADVGAGTDLVMLSSAVYTKIDEGSPATYSSTVVTGMLRGDLGFHGVVVSDDLLGKALSTTAVQRRGVDLVRAGGDLALVGEVGAAVTVHDGLLDRARTDVAFRDRVRQSAVRVVTLKGREGLAACAG